MVLVGLGFYVFLVIMGVVVGDFFFRMCGCEWLFGFL